LTIKVSYVECKVMRQPRKINYRIIKAVLFDLDGVLVDSYYAWFHQFNDALKYFGHQPVTKKVFRKHWGQSTEEDVRIFMPERTVDEIKKYFDMHFGEYVSYLKVNRNAERTLKKLHKMNLKLGCVTNSHRGITRKILTDTKLKHFFKVIVTADDVKRPKPAPDMILKACKILKVLPTETIFIGDTETDIESGNNAGCIVIGYKIKSKHRVKNLKTLEIF